MLYGDAPDVHARVLEYCGATRTDPPSAAYVATLRGGDDPFLTWRSALRHPTSEVVSLLHAGDDGYALTPLGRGLVVAFDPLSRWALRWRRAL